MLMRQHHVSERRACPVVGQHRSSNQTDSRDRERHLQDAALLLAVIEDPYAERELFAGSDRSRLLTLARALPDSAAHWRTLPAEARANGQAALRILNA